MCLMCASNREEQPVKGRGLSATWLNPLRLPTLILLGIIMFHRKVLSRLTPPTCRFTPSCSRYALDAVKRYGAIRGGLLAVWRVLRCNPIHPGGYDPLI